VLDRLGDVGPRLQQVLSFGSKVAVLADQARAHLRIGINALFAPAKRSNWISRAQNSFSEVGGAFQRDCAPQLAIVHDRNSDVNIDAIDSGPEILQMWRWIIIGVQWHSRVRSLKLQPGHGFMAATSMNPAGKLSGWRRARS